MVQFGASSPSASPATAHTLTRQWRLMSAGACSFLTIISLGSTTPVRINGATVPVRGARTLSGTPNQPRDQFTTSRLLDSQNPIRFMKADPAATRFGIFQVGTFSSRSRILQPLWPNDHHCGEMDTAALFAEVRPRRRPAAFGARFPAVCSSTYTSSHTILLPFASIMATEQ